MLEVSDESLDTSLGRDPWIEPSPGFRSAVLRRVYAEAELPELAFPWKRFALGVFQALLAIGGIVVGGEGLFASAPHPGELVGALILLGFAARLASHWGGPRTPRGATPPS